MAGSSELARLYEGAFGKRPSAKSMALLIRMEAFCGLSQDDPLARMLVLQLRAADHSAEVQEQRADEYKRDVAEFRQLVSELRTLLAGTRPVRFDAGIRQGGAGSAKKTLHINTYRKASPLWTYLWSAFRPRNGVLDEDERTGAARVDLAFLIAAALMICLCGLAMGRMH